MTTVTSGNIHEVNERDRVVIASTIEAWRSHGGQLEEEDLKRIPFSLTPFMEGVRTLVDKNNV